MIKVAVVDNHDSTRMGVAQSLSAQPRRFSCTGTFATVEELLEGPPSDVVVLDLYLGRDDVKSTPSIPTIIGRGAHVVLHTAEESPVPLRRAVAAGANGLSLKNDGVAALLDVVERVADGEFVCSSVLANALVTDDAVLAQLTTREVEVLVNLNDGLTHHQVARRLGISPDTVKSHLKSTREKYVVLGRHVTNTGSVVRQAADDGWLG